jgi:hypothetical protein
MLKDLLSLGLHEEVSSQYKFGEVTAFSPSTDPMDDLMWLYHYGRKFVDGRILSWVASTVSNSQEPGELLWEHAEDFLAFLDSTGESDVKRKRALDMINRNPRRLAKEKAKDLFEVRKAARRHLAAEVSYFLRDPTFEKWLPYHNWSNAIVGDDDVIVTFNYDCLLEQLPTIVDTPTVKSSEPGRITVLDSDTIAKWPPGPKALKLHGSTSWVLDRDSNDEWQVVTKSPEYAVRCYQKDESEIISKLPKSPAGQTIISRKAYKKGDGQPGYLREAHDVDLLVMSTPGPTKFRNNFVLRPWWDKAVEALRDAGAIVFIGYRFPPSDTHALKTLLGAVSENNDPSLKLHTVLGPKLDDDTARLEQLLQYATKSKGKIGVQVHRLWSQDFMTVARRCDLVD